MNVTHWAILALANMLAAYAILGHWHYPYAEPPVAVGLSLLVLAMPLMPLAAVDLGTLF